MESGEQDKLSPLSGQTFDLVLMPLVTTANSYIESGLENLKSLIEPGGLLLTVSNIDTRTLKGGNSMDIVNCRLSDGATHISLARMSDTTDKLDSLTKSRCVVVDHGMNDLSEAIMSKIATISGQTVARFAFDEIAEESISQGDTVFCLFESEKPILVSTTNENMDVIKHITNKASNIIWVTGGDLLNGGLPEVALVSGVARALVLEQPSLRFFTFDVDDVQSHIDRTAEHLVSVLTQRHETLDKEFVQRKGVVHVSRFVPDDALNDSFRQKQGTELVEMPIDDAKPAQLSIAKPGQFDTLFFKQIDLPTALKATDVQIQVKAIGLNAKDFYVLAGKVDTLNSTCSLEFCGIVERVGASVFTISPGDRVVAMAPSPFQTTQFVPEWACQKLKDDENFNVLSTIPLVHATAIYALHYRAHIKRNETILIHSGAGGVGIAAIQLALLAGAEVFTTVSTEAKKDYLVKNFCIKPSHIFSSRDSSFLDGILKATNGKGVDIVLNSLTGDLLHASWRCCGSFGRFIEIGKRDLTDAGKLEMNQFLKNATFTAFDLSYLYNTDSMVLNETWGCLLREALWLYREKKIVKVDPLEIFDISDVTKAFRYFSSRNRMGKIAINLDNPNSTVPVQLAKYRTRFSPHKSYIMVGCLGGLGRSLAQWMISRGAKKFVFLGRSGTDREPARRLIESLKSSGAECRVVRGDVCNKDDVEEVMNQVEGFVGGVVQAAMGLNEALFTSMSNEFWHSAIDPKVLGTWNLHNAIKGRDSALEFFLMTSSISGSVGTATESNYCSANYFLDIFARYRRSLGLPAISIGLGMISEVGYLHENPEIEALLLRKGIQAINEDELLQIVDIALSSTPHLPHAYDNLAHAHILTGLEPFGLKELRKKGFEGTNPTLDDPRASVLAGALDGQADLAYKKQDGNLPADVVSALENDIPLCEAILAHVTKRFGNLVLMPCAQVDVAKPLAEYGMDSMIAAEFRTWFFQSFKVDIPFLTLLSKSSTVASLSDSVVSQLEAERTDE